MCSAEGDVFKTVRILCSVNSDCNKCSIKERYLLTECSEQKWSIHQHSSQMKVWERNEKKKSRHKYYCSLLILKLCHCSESSYLLMKNPLTPRFRLEGKIECLTLIRMPRVHNWYYKKWWQSSFFFACLMHTAQELLGRDSRETIHQHHIIWTRIHFMAILKPLGTWY